MLHIFLLCGKNNDDKGFYTRTYYYTKGRFIMFTASTKKQNRVLLITLVVLLFSAAALIAVTGGANRKTAAETDPPIESGTLSESAKNTENENKADSKQNAADDTFGKTKDSGTSDKSSDEKSPAESTDENNAESEKKTSAEPDADTEVSAASSSGVLPRFACPVSGGIVLKAFSGTVPVFSYTMNDYRIHTGIDLAASAGSPVYAAADGIVKGIEDDPMMGVCVTIEHTGGAVTKYKGLSEDSLAITKQGDAVTCGQVIGSAGSTALIESAEEDHVHFELCIGGENKDPAEYISVKSISEIYEN